MDGSEGIIYLSFVGAERYVAQIQDPLLKFGFYKKKENVNQSFQRLLGKNQNDLFLKYVKQLEDKPGRPKIYTANYEPILLTLKDIDSEIDEKLLIEVLNDFSFVYSDFIRHLLNNKKQINHKQLKWRIVLARYLSFISTTCFMPFSVDSVLNSSDKMKINPLLSFINNKHKTSHDNQTMISKKIDDLMKRNDLSRNTFISELFKKFQDTSLKLVFGKHTGEVMQTISKLSNTFDNFL